MAEALVFLSAIPATTQLIEQAFRIFARMRKAHERQKSLVDVLTRHEDELRGIKAIIGVIEDEEDLHTSSVMAELLRLRDAQTKLAKVLETLDPKAKSKVNQIARQFVQGSSDERKMSAVMDQVVHAKISLLLHIQIANVREVGNVEKRLVANAVVIQRIDESLRELKTCEGLRIARLLKGRRLSEDGTVPMTVEEMNSLIIEEGNESSGDETLVDDAELRSRKLSVKTEKIIQQNTARHQAAQINAPTEIDLWKDVSRVVVTDNVAEGQALQINYASTWEITSKFLDHHREKTASMLRPKRHDIVYRN
ncbi:hypothetical protein SLS61_009104 [Didymella pomorum]